MRNITLLLLLLSSFLVSAQRGKIISGQVTVRDGEASGISVVNLVNETETMTDAEGRFSIRASEGDLLVLSGDHIDFVRRMVRADDYAAGSIAIRITARPIELDEVAVKPGDRMDAVSMGILTKPAKKYTPAERKIFTATSTVLDRLVNKISGRTKQLKRVAEVERKEMLLQQLDGVWPADYYASLGIEPDRIKGFHYFLVDSPEFAQSMKSGDIVQLTLLTFELADKYNKQVNAKD